MLRPSFLLPLLSTRLYQAVRKFLRNDQLILALLSLFIGLVCGVMVIALRETISFFQFSFYGAPGERLYDTVAALPWWQILAVPTLGGLAVGLLVRYAMPGGRTQGVADVIEASALKGGRMSLSTWLACCCGQCAVDWLGCVGWARRASGAFGRVVGGMDRQETSSQSIFVAHAFGLWRCGGGGGVVQRADCGRAVRQ